MERKNSKPEIIREHSNNLKHKLIWDKRFSQSKKDNTNQYGYNNHRNSVNGTAKYYGKTNVNNYPRFLAAKTESLKKLKERDISGLNLPDESGFKSIVNFVKDLHEVLPKFKIEMPKKSADVIVEPIEELIGKPKHSKGKLTLLKRQFIKTRLFELDRKSVV